MSGAAPAREALPSVSPSSVVAIPVVEEPGEELAGPRFRLATLVVLVGLFVGGQVAAALGLRLLGELSTSVFLQVGPGVVGCAFLVPLPRHLHVLLSIVGGAAATAVLASLAALTGAVGLTQLWWFLATVVLVGAVAGAVRQVLVLRRFPSGPVQVGRTAWTRERVLPTMLTLVGLVVALVTAAVHAGVPQPGGAALTAGPVWVAGVVLVLVALGLAYVWQGSVVLPVLALSTVVVASQGLMYREPTAVVAARHVGMVGYILENGVLDRSTDIYQAWAGLFASGALNVRAAGIDDVFGYAAWWGVLAAPVMVLAVRCLAGRFVDQRRAWLAALVFGLASSLNTSFFAPQVFGFILAITSLALLAVAPGRRLPLPLPATVGVILVLSVANALSHQISPYMLTLALVALAVFRLTRPWWGAALALVPAVAWALINQHLLTSYVSVSAIGRLTQNLSPPEHSVGTFPLPLANRLAFDLPAVALVVVGLAALVSLARRRDRIAWGLAAAAGSPVVLMAGTNYGNEGVFRVVLFALPWLALLAWLPTTRPTLRLPGRRILLAVAATLLLGMNVVGLTAMDWARVVRSDDVAAAQWVERGAAPGTLVLALGSDLTMPERSLPSYPDVAWISREGLIPPPARAYPTTTGDAYDAAGDLADLTTRFAAVEGSAHYVVAAESTGAYDQRYGNQRFADSQKLRAAIAASDAWVQVYSVPGATVYRLRAELP